MKPHARRQRGVSLVEAMVAFVVAGFGMLALVGVQSTLRSNADIAKQRTEALRLGEQYLEGLRAFPDLARYAQLEAEPAPAPVTVGNATYTIAKAVQARTAPDPERLEITVTVSWQDRLSPANETSSVVLSSVIAGIDPALSGWLAAPPVPSAWHRPHGRHPSIPLQAVELGGGRSGFVPPGADGIAWVFQNGTGRVSVCAVAPGTLTVGLTAGGLTSCTPQNGYLVSGHVRFATGTAAVTAAEAENPTSPALDLAVILTATLGSSPGCYDDAPIGPTLATSVAYYCLVYGAGDSGRWSGRVDVLPTETAGWTTTPGADNSHKVCRYSADYDGNTSIGNDEHPASYADVAASLVNQNFLVIRAVNACPTDVAPNPAAGDFVNSNTVQHAPVSGG
ncbi:prepilin-type N-terminal cleavage/methylation domain-containing protein [Aquabacterium sp. J223]|uniref:type IV pilus modification PilV family protein n=1 Tax=Aquabacterium sp. J223 TaxID=2898431 RepID=UPI0021AE28BC|nr:prepilin-type N-terminal cleavage/methylation domain-containing protein [Aquabacterium sp. J223]UUX94605.1 prepilin-type N-terminal cleavage/methylation domain-containing protein [Aquabacterium sp. J223]